MMLMKALVLVVAGVSPSVLRVVQGQTTDPCGEFNKKKCGKKDKCTWNSAIEFCLLTAGTGSVVREGSENTASGKYSVVGGGQWNNAGSIDDAYNVIGGGDSNVCYGGSTNTVSGGNTNGIVPIDDADADVPDFNTISGGWTNIITDKSYSVITGGGGDSDGEVDGDSNIIQGCDTSTISGGKKNRIGPLPPDVGGDGNTISGGFDNIIEKSDMQYRTITGGLENDVKGQGAVVSGGERNGAYNTNSLAFGQNAAAIFDHSMVVNLIGGDVTDDPLLGTKDGEFLVSAESFLFQIGDGNDGIDSTELTKTNIQNLRTALEEEE
mmetsp:Transcript_5128/g.5712  ORF Transcript_5128/g.5712 Transcript_5128/m.5712 type:complete len:323 (+) Transcript_5128:47-1015(+)